MAGDMEARQPPFKPGLMMLHKGQSLGALETVDIYIFLTGGGGLFTELKMPWVPQFPFHKRIIQPEKHKVTSEWHQSTCREV